MLAHLLNRAECPKELQGLSDNPRMRALQGVLDYSVKALAKHSVSEVLELAKNKMGETYEGGMFAYDWQAEEFAMHDLEKLKRAFEYVFSEGEEVVAVKQYASMSVPDKEFVDHFVDLVVKRPNGNYVAVNFHLGKSKRSAKGKTPVTQDYADPITLVTKGGLEKKYPGIVVWDIYLTNERDTVSDIVPELDTSALKTGQLKVNAYNQAPVNFYDGDTFKMEEFTKYAYEIFENPGKPNCELCQNAYLCKNGVPKLEPCYDVVEESNESKTYRLPTFSDEQEKIIKKKDGAFLVVAGPGSGKTATLVGRLNYLVNECDVPPEFILAISFTNKAAGEIRERCKSFLNEGEEIECSTLNALGYRILMNHAEEFGVDEFKLLTKDKKLQLIDDLLHSLSKPLEGFKYEMKFGDTGLLSTIARRMEEYALNPEECLEKHGLGEDFVNFAETFYHTIKTGGYIDYKEQISLCVKLLEEHEDILEIYQNSYWYVCVDEVQDIDSLQCKLIDMLAAKHHNLMMIGDDDQSIFEWRGASPSFMLGFKERYPEGELYFLSRNYRCSDNIVSLAKNSIVGSLERFDKNIVAVKGPGAPVDVMDGDPTQKVSEIMSKLLSDGVKPDDIAVLSWNHKTLIEVCKNLPNLPLKLEGELLCRSAFFTFIKSALNLLHDSKDEKARWEYFSVFGLPKPKIAEYEESYLMAEPEFPYVEIGNETSAYKCLKALGANVDMSVREFLKYAAEISGYRNQLVLGQMLDELVEQRGVKTLANLHDVMNMMVDAGDDKKLEAVYPGKTLLATVHTAKGREWKHVIVLDDFGIKDSASIRRLIYVALTRAEDNLYIVRTNGAKSLLAPAV